MPDDWLGHPQRKDYPLGGIPVEYKGATVPPGGRAEVVQLMAGRTARTSAPRPAPAAGTEGQGPTEFTAVGGDWADIAAEAEALGEERIVVNMGPQHPSTHGVLRLILEIDGETVTEARAGVGYLHTGIEKNMEFRTWTQGVTFCTRMDYVAPIFQEVAYCLAVEKLLGITDQIPERATLIRVLMMELNRISSHLVAVGTGGNELGATTIMTISFREREEILRVFERVTGLRMNHAYIRPGGVAQDLPPGTIEMIREKLPVIAKGIGELEDLMLANPIFKGRMVGVGLPPPGRAPWPSGSPGRCSARPACRSTCARRSRTAGTSTYDFDVPTTTESDSYSRGRPAHGGVSSRSGSSPRCWTGSRLSARHRSWSPTRRSPGPRSSPSARTGRATRSSTSGRSWAPRWRP